MWPVFTSCHDEDFGVSSETLKNRAYAHGFAQEFGRPGSDQRWDFHTQMLERLSGSDGVTRAYGDEHEYHVNNTTFTLTEDSYGVAILSNDKRNSQNNTIKPTYNSNVAQHDLDQTLIEEWKLALPEKNSTNTAIADNRGKGVTGYNLKSPPTGLFTVSAVMYNGMYARSTTNNMEFGIELSNGRRYRLFGGAGRLNDGTAYPLWNSPAEYWYGETVAHNREAIEKWGTWTSAQNEAQEPNPLWAAYVYITPDTNFKFYFTNSKTSSTGYTSDIEGRSMLLYNAETDNQRFMMIGFEDAVPAQTDINDFIIYVQGDLPPTTSKRFICEDQYSLDWDYNDLVFDVSNTGITLRAIGGTLPVYLQIKDKQGNSAKVNYNGSNVNLETVELHELLGSLQTDPSMQGRELTYVSSYDGETYYKPINVGDTKHGIKLDPIKIITWSDTYNTSYRLTDSELESWGYKKDNDARNYFTFFVGGDELKNVKDVTKVNYNPVAEYPSCIEVPYTVSWMKELTKITLGYPTFYQGNNPGPGQTEDDQWYNYEKVVGNFYTYSGDSE